MLSLGCGRGGCGRGCGCEGRGALKRPGMAERFQSLPSCRKVARRTPDEVAKLSKSSVKVVQSRRKVGLGRVWLEIGQTSAKLADSGSSSTPSFWETGQLWGDSGSRLPRAAHPPCSPRASKASHGAGTHLQMARGEPMWRGVLLAARIVNNITAAMLICRCCWRLRRSRTCHCRPSFACHRPPGIIRTTAGRTIPPPYPATWSWHNSNCLTNDKNTGAHPARRAEFSTSFCS